MDVRVRELEIRFSVGYGCRPAEDVVPALAALVPTDIHLTCDL